MNHLTWIGIIVWGLFLSCFGLIGDGAPPQDVMFLLAGGTVTCLIGTLGLVGCLGWVPGWRREQKSYS